VLDAAGQFRTDIEIDEIYVPENVRLIIGRRLERLDENEMRVLAAAAVIGRSFSFQLLTAIATPSSARPFCHKAMRSQGGICLILFSLTGHPPRPQLWPRSKKSNANTFCGSCRRALDSNMQPPRWESTPQRSGVNVGAINWTLVSMPSSNCKVQRPLLR
jgi:hypothetical protein